VSMKWILAESDENAVAALGMHAGLHPLIARLLVNRGITAEADARFFLSCELSTLSDPALFSQMEQSVVRIRSAIADGEKIIVYGDYDVDGVSGTSLLFQALRRLGARIGIYIPNRLTEGYGLNAAALEAIRNDGAKLVISVDCGITAHREAAVARSLGLDLIITDHHEFVNANGADGTSAPESADVITLPDAYAILHPLRLLPGVTEDMRRRVAGLTGVGIAFKLAQALLNEQPDNEHLSSYLDLVALGTIADVGKITGENRILVRYGLESMSSTTPPRTGIAALKQLAGLNGKKIGVGTVGFTIAPRLNASGRLDRADMAFRLLTTESPKEASELALALDLMNRERQSIEEGIFEEARSLCIQADPVTSGALVLSSEEWHPGVVGIVASKIVEEFYRPTALICVKNGIGKGSARSIPCFDLYEGLTECSDLLLGFGGHKYAAGFSLREENIGMFRQRLSALVGEKIGSDGFVRTLCIDGAVMLDDLTFDLMEEIDKMAPFGQGNPEPRLGARRLRVVSSRIVGKSHLKLKLRQGSGKTIDAIAFDKASLLGKQVRDGAQLAAVFTPRVIVWNGSRKVELEIRDIKPDQ
jgi:single-stranded-DNA-specific exonuclease